MKVFPITVFQPKGDGGFNARVSCGDVQQNVDHNNGYAHFTPGQPERTDRVAIVGYGPSLKRTAGEIGEGFDAIWTVSGAHDFLLGKGINPTHHTDIDWRAHKAHMVTPREGVRYVMANTIHPRYAAKLKTHALTMFQPVGEKETPFFRYGEYPKLRVPGDVTTAAMVAAYELGYREFELFGVDGSEDLDASHAGEHNGVKSDVVYVTDTEFTLYKTTQALIVSNMIMCATIDALEAKGCEISINSDGLLPRWVKMHNARKVKHG